MSCPEGSLSTGAFRRRAGLVALRLLVGAISDRTQLLQAASSATADPENLHRIADDTGTTVDEAAEELSKAMPKWSTSCPQMASCRQTTRSGLS
jgi:hypothetical protein